MHCRSWEIVPERPFGRHKSASRTNADEARVLLRLPGVQVSVSLVKYHQDAVLTRQGRTLLSEGHYRRNQPADKNGRIKMKST